MNNWRDGNSIGTMYLLEDNDLSRVGDCWIKGRLHAGDVVLCTAHSGDCFNDYVLINPFHNGSTTVLKQSWDRLLVRMFSVRHYIGNHQRENIIFYLLVKE